MTNAFSEPKGGVTIINLVEGIALLYLRCVFRTSLESSTQLQKKNSELV